MKENLQDIEKRLSEYRTATWSELPDLDLYMDQVVTYVQKHLELFPVGTERKACNACNPEQQCQSGAHPKAA